MDGQNYKGLTAFFMGENIGNAVFFASCAEDISYRDRFLQEIQKVGAQISYWYLDNPEDLAKEEIKQAFLDDLKEMKLVVIPITSRFFDSKDNYARDIVIPYCVEKHIPLLPIMMEPGLADSFNYICGNIQFLEYSQYDSTAVSFDVKLANFIHDVLLSEEYMAQIRDMFVAYIFLSYRKKDRKEAQEIMRQIHAYDGCEDLAIWYDEFLTPGEDFNVSIMEALKKSKLFALVVTPSLLEEQNYVARIEYPEAKKMDKPVLPIMARPTDYEKLYEMFQLTPECIKEAQGISDDLRPLTDRNAGPLTPQKQFLLGLAYLNGIDVEIDYERAVRLLTASGNRGFEPAVKQLIFMYDNGFGVKQDAKQAINWALKYNEMLEAQPLTDADIAKKRLENLRDLADRYLAESDSTNAVTYYRKALDLVNEVTKMDFMEASRSWLYTFVFSVWAKTDDVGYVNFSENFVQKIILEWRFALSPAIFYSDDDKLSSHEKMYRNMYRSVVFNEIDGIKATKQEFETVIRETNSDRYRRDLFLLNRYLIRIMRKKNVACSEILAILEEQEELFATYINVTLEDKIMFAVARRNRADILFLEGNPSEAETYYQKAVDVLEDILKDRKIAEAMKELYFAYQGLYDVTDEKADLEKKKFYANKGYELSIALMDFVPCFNSLCFKADAGAEMMHMARLEGNDDEIIQYQEELTGTLKEVEKTNSMAYQKLLFKTGSTFNIEDLEKMYRGMYRFLKWLGFGLVILAFLQLFKGHMVRFVLLLLFGLFLAWTSIYNMSPKRETIRESAMKTNKVALEVFEVMRIFPRDLELKKDKRENSSEK